MSVQPLKRAKVESDSFPTALLDSLSEAIVVVDGNGLVHYANLSAEQFFGVGRARLVGHPHSEVVRRLDFGHGEDADVGQGFRLEREGRNPMPGVGTEGTRDIHQIGNDRAGGGVE